MVVTTALKSGGDIYSALRVVWTQEWLGISLEKPTKVQLRLRVPLRIS